MPFTPRIAILGAGPAGLTLAHLLTAHQIPYTIFDLRPKPTPASLAAPSGMLDLHEESGLRAIRACGLWDTFQAALGDCSEATKVMTPEGTVLHEDGGRGAYRPEVSRNKLTEMLGKGVQEVRWGTKVMGAPTERTEGGTEEVVLEFENGADERFDFAVGADGAWSRARNMRCDVAPRYTGAQLLTVTVRDVSRRFPHLAKLNGTGSLMALGGGNGMTTHRGPQDSIRIYAFVRTPDKEWAKTNGFRGETAKEVCHALLNDKNVFANWCPELRDLFTTACEEETTDKPGAAADILGMYVLPTDQQWEGSSTMTLVGDAAHLMIPFAGEGVNLAMWDALDLAQILVDVPKVDNAKAWHTALEPRLRDFEANMLDRARDKSEESIRNQGMLLSENGAQKLVEIFTMYGMEVGADAVDKH